MSAYKKLLIQQQNYNGSEYVNVGSAIDSYSRYKVVCQESPFKHLPEIKDLAKRDWYDEHGEDVYVPTDGLKFKAYDIEIRFLYVGTESAISSDLRDFIDFLAGKNSDGKPMLAIYDEYTKVGRRGMYMLSYNNDLFYYSDTDTQAIATFTVKFRVTDPVTLLDQNFNVK